MVVNKLQPMPAPAPMSTKVAGAANFAVLCFLLPLPELPSMASAAAMAMVAVAADAAAVTAAGNAMGQLVHSGPHSAATHAMLPMELNTPNSLDMGSVWMPHRLPRRLDASMAPRANASKLQSARCRQGGVGRAVQAGCGMHLQTLLHPWRAATHYKTAGRPPHL